MHVITTKNSDTEVTLTISIEEDKLTTLKDHVLGHFKSRVKVPGFREGKVPLPLIEKHVDPAALQTEFLEEAINNYYGDAIRQEDLRPVDNPEITLKKFVPFTTLEFEAKVTVLGQVKLPDYKKIKKSKKSLEITDKDIDEIMNSLKKRLAEKKDVDRVAKLGDETWIDFKGVDDKGEPVAGAEGKDYPLAIGSNAFIPGFEENLIGLKAGDDKTFTLKFPKDYNVKALANKDVTFTVTVTKVQEVAEPKVDEVFAAKVGPFKSVKELEGDIKKQLTHERQHEIDRDFESELVKEITEKSKVTVPEVMINDQVERMVAEIKQNVTYRGQTWQEYLEQEGKTEEEFRNDVLTPQAVERVKAGLVLAEIAEQEHLEVTPEELEIRVQILKNQYQDQQMQAELDKPENRREIASRLLTEKTLNKLTSYATSK
jgi:trigger factor